MGELSDAASALDYLQAMNPNAEQCWVGGYSFGGRLAYEVARQLTDSGEPPLAIVVLDASARQASRRLTWRDLGPIAANAGPWLVNELRHYGPRDLAPVAPPPPPAA